jgi:sigma-B regulation protein RsbU (phosphoserine phosphatase)
MLARLPSSPTDEDLRRGLTRPNVAAVETLQGRRGSVARRLERWAPSPFLLVSLSTRTAVETPVAQIFVEALAERLDLDPDVRERVETALHETIVNAAIHGNLELAMAGGAGRDEVVYGAYYDRVMAALSHSPLAERRVIVAATSQAGVLLLTVMDEGFGFLANHGVLLESVDEASGRGISMIRALTDGMRFEDGGRCLTMSFHLGLRHPRGSLAEETRAASLIVRRSGVERLAAGRILVADHVPGHGELLVDLLESEGFANIELVRDGDAALEAMFERPADIALLELALPGLSALDLMRRIVVLAADQRPQVVIQTAFGSARDRAIAFEAGAADVLAKPLRGAEVLARVRTLMENRTLFRDLSDYRARLEGELLGARQTQQRLLPSAKEIRDILGSVGLRCDGYFAACTELGGDMWMLRGLFPDTVAILLVDFSGHGIAASLNTFRMHALFSEMTQAPNNLGVYFTELNAKLHAMLPAGQFAAMFLAMIDLARGVIRHVGAAMPDPLLILPNGEHRFLDGIGFPIGASPDADYVESVAPFPRGSRLIMFSDALVEIEDDAGAMLGKEDLVGLIDEFRAADRPSMVIATVLARFFKGRGHPLADDLTLVSLFRD